MVKMMELYESLDQWNRDRPIWQMLHQARMKGSEGELLYAQLSDICHVKSLSRR
jgi:hypothetical protein